MKRYIVDDLQAVEPDELTEREGVEVFVSPDLDSMGFNRVEVAADSRDLILDYVRENWGDEDADWFRDWVESRIIDLHEYRASRLVEAVESGDAEALAAAEALVCEDAGIPPDETERGLTAAAVEKIERHVSDRLGRDWTYGDSAAGGRPADRADEEPYREFLVHLNVQVPAETTTDTDELVAQIKGALEVGTDPDQTPALAVATVEVALAEEI